MFSQGSYTVAHVVARAAGATDRASQGRGLLPVALVVTDVVAAVAWCGAGGSSALNDAVAAPASTPLLSPSPSLGLPPCARSGMPPPLKQEERPGTPLKPPPKLPPPLTPLTRTAASRTCPASASRKRGVFLPRAVQCGVAWRSVAGQGSAAQRVSHGE